MKYVDYNTNVDVNPNVIHPSNNVEITYNGLLSQGGADELYVHCGTAYTHDWQNVQDVKMTKNTNGSFTANVSVTDGNTFNVCFRDAADNWDNNNGKNYQFKIKK